MLLTAASAGAQEPTSPDTVETTVPAQTVEIPVPPAPTTTTTTPATTTPPSSAPPLQPTVAPPAAVPLPNTGGAPWLVALSGLALVLIGAGVRLRVSQDPVFGHM